MSIALPVAPTTATGEKARVASPRGVSALMYACQQGDVEKVRRLLRAQPEVIGKRDRTGKSALHYCCTSDNICAAQAADILVMAAPDLVEGRDEDGFTPLHLAVIAGNMPLVTFLLANNADINAVDSEKHTVVHWATVCGETGALRAVLAAGAPVSTPDVHGGYPLHYAAQMCGGEKDSSLGLQVLQTLLHHPEIKVTVEDGDGRQPLLWAASAGSAKAVLALIRAGSTVNAPDKDGLTALHCAASRGHTDCIDTLLTLCGMSADVIDSNGCTALHYSVTLGHADATALLLTHGADPNRQDRKGRSPAHCGCSKGQFETVKMIGAQNANLWLRNARGDLPLHEAAGSGRRDLVKWLLEARPSQVNARNNDGRCPLHLAALNDNSDMCKILLDTGAQVNPVLRSSKNVFMTPLDCALQKGFRSTAKYLQVHGGMPANRLSTSKINLPNGGVHVHIREDVTLADTSDSEREHDERDDKVKRKHRKKLTYRYERRKTNIDEKAEDGKNKSSGEKERRKREKSANQRKPSGEEGKRKTDRLEKSKENVTYSSEVKITNNYGGINIEKNGEIIISDGTPILKKTDQTKISPTTKNESDLILPETIKDTSKFKSTDSGRIVLPEVGPSDTNNNRTKEEISTKVALSFPTEGKTMGDIGENIEEIKTLANTIEQTAKSITQEVIHIQQNLQDDTLKVKQPDQFSYTSADESEHKELVVEAAIHQPPKSPDIRNIEQATTTDAEESTVVAVEEEEKQTENDLILNAHHTVSKEEVDITTSEEPKSKPLEVKRDHGDIKSEDHALKSEDHVMKQDHDLKSKESKSDHYVSIPEPVQQDLKQKLDGETADDQEIIDEVTKTIDEQINIEETSTEVVVTTNDKQKSEIKEETPKEVEIHHEFQELQTTSKDDTSISIDTPDTVKLVDKTIIAEQEYDADQKIELVEDETSKGTEEYNFPKDKETQKIAKSPDLKDETPEGGILKEDEDSSKHEDESPKESDTQPEDMLEKEDTTLKQEDTSMQEDSSITLEDSSTKLEDSDIIKQEDSDIKYKEVISKIEESKLKRNGKGSKIKTEGVTAVNVETKERPQKRKFLKEQKSKRFEEVTPKGKTTPQGKLTKNGGSKQEKTKTTKREKPKREVKSKEAEKPKSKTTKTEVREKSRDKGPKKAIEKILEFTDGSNEAKKRRKVTDEESQLKRRQSRSSSLEISEEEASTSSESDRQRKHKSFTVLDVNEDKKKVRISRSKSPIRPLDYKEEKSYKRSKIPTPVFNLRKDMSKSDKQLDKNIQNGLDARISLPNLSEDFRFQTRSETNMSAPLRLSAYSDNERSASDVDDITKSAARRRRLRKRMKRDSRSAGSDYESSNLIDSGFEPSPRSSRIPKWKNMSERGVNMTSVTQNIQTNIRRYHLERKIFQHLLELKRHQIRSGQHNEAVLVKRAIDEYHNSCASTVGAGKYVPEDYTFKSFEKFLYHSLRKLQKNGIEHLRGLPESPDNPLLCTQSTHRCLHATHAYTGIPCAAYLPRMDHHTIPKIGYPCKPQGFLPHITPKKTVTLELCHGSDKQVISLPTDRLDQNKRYYVTFTVKGQEPTSPNHDVETKDGAHRHAKSV